MGFSTNISNNDAIAIKKRQYLIQGISCIASAVFLSAYSFYIYPSIVNLLKEFNTPIPFIVNAFPILIPIIALFLGGYGIYQILVLRNNNIAIPKKRSTSAGLFFQWDLMDKTSFIISTVSTIVLILIIYISFSLPLSSISKIIN